MVETMLVCERYEMHHKKAFVPSVEGIGLLCSIKADSPVKFVERLQRSSTWYLILLDGSVNFCEKFVV